MFLFYQILDKQQSLSQPAATSVQWHGGPEVSITALEHWDKQRNESKRAFPDWLRGNSYK